MNIKFKPHLIHRNKLIQIENHLTHHKLVIDPLTVKMAIIGQISATERINILDHAVHCSNYNYLISLLTSLMEWSITQVPRHQMSFLPGLGK